ncbi:hypothetical protein F5Y17DRAFT_450609 [Xylariaceae sp. FL0594]|nr:hypothetical protein F5Y17DRAFT_450609 [Xylariaceae sp. FL0594]
MPPARVLLRGSLLRPQLDAAFAGLVPRPRHRCVCAHASSKAHLPPSRRHHSTTTTATTSTTPPPAPQPPSETSEPTIPPSPLPQTEADLLETQTQAQEATPPPKQSDPIPGPNNAMSFWHRLGPLTRAGRAYGRAQRRRPWATQVASALVVYLFADFGAQSMGASSSTGDKVEEGEGIGGDERKGHDWTRTARSLWIGGSSAIPGYIWFSYLSHNFNYPSRWLSIAIKVSINQVLFTPFFNIYFFGSHALLSGDTAAEAWRRVVNTVPVSWVNSCKLWPAVTAFSFAFVPFEYRNLFGGVVAVGWQTYLSFLNARAEKMEMLRQKEEKEKEKGEAARVQKPTSSTTDATLTLGATGAAMPAAA